MDGMQDPQDAQGAVLADPNATINIGTKALEVTESQRMRSQFYLQTFFTLLFNFSTVVILFYLFISPNVTTAAKTTPHRFNAFFSLPFNLLFYSSKRKEYIIKNTAWVEIFSCIIVILFVYSLLCLLTLVVCFSFPSLIAVVQQNPFMIGMWPYQVIWEWMVRLVQKLLMLMKRVVVVQRDDVGKGNGMGSMGSMGSNGNGSTIANMTNTLSAGKRAFLQTYKKSVQYITGKPKPKSTQQAQQGQGQNIIQTSTFSV